MSGFLFNLWDRTEELGGKLIPNNESFRIVGVNFPTYDLAAQFCKVCGNEQMWENPIRTGVHQSGTLVLIGWD